RSLAFTRLGANTEPVFDDTGRTVLMVASAAEPFRVWSWSWQMSRSRKLLGGHERQAALEQWRGMIGWRGARSRDGATSITVSTGRSGRSQLVVWQGAHRSAVLTGADAAEFSPDGRYILAIATGETARVWDWRRDRVVARLPVRSE